MELKEILQIYKKNTSLLVKFILLFGVFGWLFAYLPKTYKAVGSFYVARGVDSSISQEFTYEGYYAQQAGTNYAGTLIGLFESVDIRKTALESLDIPVTETNLRHASRNIKAKKAAPQLVTLTIKANSSELAERTWLSLSEAATTASQLLNQVSGDPLLTVIPLGETPIVYELYTEVGANIAVGAALGLVFGFFYIAFKEYLS